MSPPSSYGIFGNLDLPCAFGTLQLSVEGRPPEPQSIELICQALDAGIRVLDTADSYCQNKRDLHFGERLVRNALDAWQGPRESVRVITKAGLTRPSGRWVPNGSRAHVREAVARSLAWLDVDQIYLLLLHVRDPRRSFQETLEALAELQQEGKVLHLGLCNATLPELLQAERCFPVAAVQNELSVMNRKAAADGVLAYAQRRGIPLLAYRPLGGPSKVAKLAGNRTLKPLVERQRLSPPEAAIATIADLGAPVIPLFGATRPETLASTLRAAVFSLNGSDRQALQQRISFAPKPFVSTLLAADISPAQLRPLAAGEAPGVDPEVVIIMGIQGAGKSTHVSRYVEAGYLRLNRDQLGGALDDILGPLERALEQGEVRVVLDNTYPTVASRLPVIRVAHAFGVPVRCKHIDTSYPDAVRNVIGRVLQRYGDLPGPTALKQLAKTDPNLPPIAALKRWSESYEPATTSEGFSVVETVPFQRHLQPGAQQKALLLDVDGTIRTTASGEIYPRSADDVRLLPGRRAVLQRWLDDGYQLFFVSNQSGIASGKLTQDQADAAFARTVQLLDLPVTEIAYCPHKAFPVTCFCRKPLPGIGLRLAHKHNLDLTAIVMVGDREDDRGFAAALGATYHDASDFFPPATG